MEHIACFLDAHATLKLPFLSLRTFLVRDAAEGSAFRFTGLSILSNVTDLLLKAFPGASAAELIAVDLHLGGGGIDIDDRGGLSAETA